MGSIFSCVKPSSENKQTENKSQIITETEAAKIEKQNSGNIPVGRTLKDEKGAQISERNVSQVESVALRHDVVIARREDGSHLVDRAKRLSDRLSCYMLNKDNKLHKTENDSQINQDLVHKLSQCIDKGSYHN